MYTHKLRLSVAGALAVTVLSFGVLAPVAHAELISQEQVEEQNRTVLLKTVDVLRENVKLLQMQLIRRLEAQVTSLQAQVDAQSP